ncbi:hypothetical protein MNV49_000092 [Pseudohyphozyma bogoriensis]|nr:hypothetical protein MNV49_000092 [Pseudohyphozyma bogoriensis]
MPPNWGKGQLEADASVRLASEKTQERISFGLAIGLAGGIPAGIIVFIGLFWRRSIWDVHNGILGLLLAVCITTSITEMIKISVGRPRPDMLDRCQPIAGAANASPYGLATIAVCAVQTGKIIDDGFKSFPSGHSSFSFAGLGFLSLYLAGKMHLFDRNGHAIKTWIFFIPLMGAALIAISRTMDYRHHATDVLIGGLLGFLIAVFTYHLYYPSLGSPKCHLPFSPIIKSDLPPAEGSDVELMSGGEGEGILSGTAQRRQARLVDYFESPDRYHIILRSLFPPGATDSVYEENSYDWSAGEVVEPWVLDAIAEVHGQGYLSYLRDIYREYVEEGGTQEVVLPDTFLRPDLLLEPDVAASPGAISIEKAGRYSFDLSCPITAGTWIAAVASARLSLEAVKQLVASDSPSIFALCRPPGHHSTPNLCGGYCYLSNAAIAIKHLQSLLRGSETKVACLDIDYHHGNGTSKVFYSDPSVLYVSLHGHPDYPYFTGSANEKGAGAGVGTNLNFPLPLGTDDTTYVSTLIEAASKISEWGAEYLVVSLGVDTFGGDPITDFTLTLDAYPQMGEVIGGLKIPTCFVMEGI